MSEASGVLDIRHLMIRPRSFFAFHALSFSHLQSDVKNIPSIDDFVGESLEQIGD